MNESSKSATSPRSAASTERPAFLASSTIKTVQPPLIRSRGTAPSVLDVPGPGSYNQDKQWTGNAVSWRPPNSPRSLRSKDIQGDSSPVKSQLSARSTTMGQRLLVKQPDYPGPGSYDPQLRSITSSHGSSPTKATCTFGVGHSDQAFTPKRENSPGPGAYDSSMNSSKGVEMKSRRDLKSREGPGPGHYELPNLMGTGLSASFKGRK